MIQNEEFAAFCRGSCDKLYHSRCLPRENINYEVHHIKAWFCPDCDPLDKVSSRIAVAIVDV